MDRPRHADGSECKPIGTCIPCYLGKHEGCTDSLSLVGCACVCNMDFE